MLYLLNQALFQNDYSCIKQMRSLKKEQLKEYKIHIKTIVLGDFRTGKSKLLTRILQGEYREGYSNTTMDYRRMKIGYNSTYFWISMYDTAGMERLRIVENAYLAHTRAILLAFDITNEQSLDNTRFWMGEYARQGDLNVPILLIANKCDLLSEDELEKTLLEFGPKIEALKQDYRCQFFAVSSKSGMGIDDVYDYLRKTLYEKYVAILENPWSDISLGESGQKKPNRCL